MDMPMTLDYTVELIIPPIAVTPRYQGIIFNCMNGEDVYYTAPAISVFRAELAALQFIYEQENN